jgi:hypothetical protein
MFKGVRWLAILDSSVLVFGSVATARLELDRYVAESHPDESLLRRLARLRGKDQTWCLLSASSRTLPSLTAGHEIHDVLAELSPELAGFAQSGNELEFGLYYRRRVEFDYEVSFASAGTARAGNDLFRRSPAEPARSASLLPALNPTVDADTLHGMIAVSMSRYKTWLSEVSARGLDQGKVITRNPE